MTQHNRAIVKEFYEARKSGDAERLDATIDRLFDDDVLWHYPGRNPLAQTYEGKAGVKEFFRTLREITKGTFQIEIEDVVAHGDHAVALELPKAIRNGDDYNWKAVLHYRLKDGLMQEVRVYQHMQYELDEFGADLEVGT